MESIPLEPVDSLTVTTLVDNVTDLLLLDEGPAKRPPFAMAAYPSVSARFIEGGSTGDALFEAAATAFDAGVTVTALIGAALVVVAGVIAATTLGGSRQKS